MDAGAAVTAAVTVEKEVLVEGTATAAGMELSALCSLAGAGRVARTLLRTACAGCTESVRPARLPSAAAAAEDMSPSAAGAEGAERGSASTPSSSSAPSWPSSSSLACASAAALRADA